ncbi:hypothetical protein JRQ81_007615 [Phrynocephalus forsythii]|uniref:Uncharacterized protein n=1 Tax=Phrynocephalus forsythii TaxID=171643 RepID=A0A9Q0XBY7_9SAUR|nr:hypothetical protein JRQ81_007615 [Phrynocephalus forsythii]
MEAAAAAREGPRPVVTFFQPRVQQEAISSYSSDQTPLRKFLPKSSLSKVILHDIPHLQRLHEIKVRELENNKKKVASMYDKMKKKFMHDQQKKMTRWKNEYARYQRMLEQMDERALMKKRDSTTVSVVDPQASSYAMWKKTPLKQERRK